MKLKYLVLLGLFLTIASCKKRPECAPGILSSCHTEIMESSTDYDICDCVCVNKDGAGYVYRSPIDDRGFCWWALGTEKSTDYEFYAFDHHHVRPDGYLERVFGKIEIYYDGEKLVNSGFSLMKVAYIMICVSPNWAITVFLPEIIQIWSPSI